MKRKALNQLRTATQFLIATIFKNETIHFFLNLLLFLILSRSANAAVTITVANASNLNYSTYNTLGNIVITEGANGDFSTSTNATVILVPPSGFQFLSGTGWVSYTLSQNITAASIVVTATTATVTMTVGGTNRTDALTISGLQVTATASCPIAATGNINMNASSTQTIAGVTTGSTSFGTLSQITSGITTGVIVGSPFTSNSSVSVPYTICGTFTGGNVFTAEISDATGAFPGTAIGSLSSTAAGTINATLPGCSVTPGSVYRIRVMSSNPAATGSDNGTNLTINSAGSSSAPGYVWADGISEPSWTDEGYAIAVDVSNNIYVTGYFQATADFDPSGGTANLIAVAGNPTDIFFAKYNSNGGYLWAKSIGSTNNDYGRGITVDATGIYLTGTFGGDADFNPGAGTAILTGGGAFFAKYDLNGGYLWAKNIMGLTSEKIAVDASNNVYIAGNLYGTADVDPGAATVNISSIASGYNDAFFAKYDASGNYLWAKLVGGTLDDYVHNIDIDGSGNVYITGEFGGTADFDPNAGTANLVANGQHDVFIAKYNSSANYLWADGIGGTANDYGYGIAVNSSTGEVFASGGFAGTVDFDPGGASANLTSFATGAGNYDGFFAKYDAGGNYLWADDIGGGGSGTHQTLIQSIAVDGTGNSFITGDFYGTSIDLDPGSGVVCYSTVGTDDIFFGKYDANGNYLCAGGIGSLGQDWSKCIAVDGSGNAVITGKFSGTGDFDPGPGTASQTIGGLFYTDIFFAKYSFSSCSALPIGLFSFTGKYLENKSVLMEWETSLEINNSYFIVERSKNENDFEEIGKVKSAGNPTQINAYSFIDKNPSDGINYYRLKQVDYDGKVTYSSIISVVIQQSNAIVVNIYPNPANTVLYSEFSAGEACSVTIWAFDLLGNLLLKDELRASRGINTHSMDIRMLPPGIYFLRINNGIDQKQFKFVKQ